MRILTRTCTLSAMIVAVPAFGFAPSTMVGACCISRGSTTPSPPAAVATDKALTAATFRMPTRNLEDAVNGAASARQGEELAKVAAAVLK